MLLLDHLMSIMYRLALALSIMHGINLSCKEVVEEHNEHNLKGENSMEATMETPRTGRQQANPMIDESKPK